MRSTRAAAFMVIACLAAAGATLVPRAEAALPAGCAAGSPGEAAAALHGPAASLHRVDAVAGIPSALVITPEIFPGVRHRLLDAGGLWCDATAGLAAVTAAHHLDGDAAARLVASTAAAAFFDDVTVSNVQRDGESVTLTTHAVTNGVVADWVVDLDGGSVTSARFTAREIGVEPFVAETEGPTALPGLSVGWGAAAGGLAAVDDPLAAMLSGRSDDPVQSSVITASDGFTIVVSRGAPYVAPTIRTAARPVDVMAVAVETTRDNYEEFLSWGLEPQWAVPVGNVFLDGPVAAACIACVAVIDTFNIHISSNVVEILEVLGARYPSWELAFSNALGHEMFHNIQAAYGIEDTTTVPVDAAYMEGFARLQESFHSYGHVSHQPDSLLYFQPEPLDFVLFSLHAGGNSCNDYLVSPGGTERMESGLAAKSYTGCYFWSSLYAEYGPPLIEGLLTALPGAVDRSADGPGHDLAHLVEAATGEPFLDAVEAFAVRSLVSSPLEWGPVSGPGAVLDWAEHLHRWTPAALQVDHHVELGPGGVTGGEITEPVEINFAISDGEARALLVTQTSAGVTVEPAVSGTTVAPPADGRRWLVAVAGVEGATFLLGEEPIPAQEFESVSTSWTSDSATSTRTDLQTAVAHHQSAADSFDLEAQVADPNPGALFLVTAEASATAEGTGAIALPPGTYDVVARFEVAAAAAGVTRRFPGDNPTTDLELWMEAACQTSVECTFASDTAEVTGPGTVELAAVITLEEADTLGFLLGATAEATAVGGDGQAHLAATLQELLVGARPTL